MLDPRAPSLTIWELDADGYGEATVVTAAEEYVASAPFGLSLVPSRLLD